MLRHNTIANPAGAANVQISTVSEDVERLAHAWEALADTVQVPPFMRPGWIIAWSRAFARGRLSLLTATRGKELIGVLPFIARRGVRSAPVNWHTPLFGCTAADADTGAALVDALVADTPVRTDLAFLDDDDSVLAACGAAAQSQGRRVIVRPVLRSPYVAVEGRTWEEYRSSLERGPRRDIERRRRRLHEQGSVSFEVADGSERLEALLDESFELEGSGWKRERGTAIDSVPMLRDFYTDVARWGAERGWLALRLLRIDGRAIACDLCLETNEVVYSLKGGFDPAFRQFAPGMIMNYESLNEAFERGRRSYEMLGADEPYKMAFTSTVRRRMRFQAFGRSPSGMASYLAWSHGRRLALTTSRVAGRITSRARTALPGRRST